MTQLPVSIEQYLLESGFSGTEILILKHLLAGGSMTLRELAAKTGKSTGVLDSASKKLLKKGILGREVINESPKLTLSSLEAVVEWVHQDAQSKRAAMDRREQDLQSFVESLSVEVNRADIQHYEGLEGMQQAYDKLLEDCAGEMFHFLPVRFTEVEDPLRDYLVQYFRLRRRRGVITRVIAHDTPLGRRYESRDPFEYRQTLLVPESVYAFNTEKVVAGDWVGTFNHEEHKAFLIRSKEMAHTEKAMFEALWKQEVAKKKEKEKAAGLEVPKEVEMGTKVASAAREFFLSRRSLAVFSGIAVLSAALTFYFYHYTQRFEFRRMQDAVKSIAATGASQFNPDHLDALHIENDWRKPEWQRVVSQLETIRLNNDDITYVYLFRKTTEDPTKMEFIADSHSRNPFANTDGDPANDVDADNDGIVDPEGHDKLQWPGQPYPDPVDEIFEAHEKPTASREMYEDEFGRVMSGFAPVKDASGRVVGILGVDMKSTLLRDRMDDIFKPFLYFLGFFLLLIVVRFGAFNRSLLLEVLQLYNLRQLIRTLITLAFIACAVTFSFYLYNLRLNFQRVQNEARSIAATAALQFEAKELENLRSYSDVIRPEYKIVISKLNKIRSENEGIKYAYIMRPVSLPYFYEFVADADSLNLNPWIDVSGDNLRNDQVPPGYSFYDENYPEDESMINALEAPSASEMPAIDPWGKWISGHAPIRDKSDRTVAIIGIDFFADRPKKLLGSPTQFIYLFGGLFLIFTTIRFIAVSKSGFRSHT